MLFRSTSKLKFAVTPTKQSLGPFLIATFRALPAKPAQHGPAPSSYSAARKLENHSTRFYSATSKLLIDNFARDLGCGISSHSSLATSHSRSNRHTYEKLELVLSTCRINKTSISNRHKTALHPRYATVARSPKPDFSKVNRR